MTGKNDSWRMNTCPCPNDCNDQAVVVEMEYVNAIMHGQEDCSNAPV